MEDTLIIKNGNFSYNYYQNNMLEQNLKFILNWIVFSEQLNIQIS